MGLFAWLHTLPLSSHVVIFFYCYFVLSLVITSMGLLDLNVALQKKKEKHYLANIHHQRPPKVNKKKRPCTLTFWLLPIINAIFCVLKGPWQRPTVFTDSSWPPLTINRFDNVINQVRPGHRLSAMGPAAASVLHHLSVCRCSML